MTYGCKYISKPQQLNEEYKRIKNTNSTFCHITYVKKEAQNSTKKIKGQKGKVGNVSVIMVKQQKIQQNDVTCTMRREAGVEALSVGAAKGPAVEDG